MIFEVLCVIHVLIWGFVLLAFLNKKWAYYNVYFVIPFIYLVHMLPFHILVALKQKVDPSNYTKHEKDVLKIMVFPPIWKKITSALHEYCFASPFTPQGMLIFGLITGIVVLHPPDFLRGTVFSRKR